MIDKYKIAKAARQISEKVVDANGFDNSKPTHLAFLEGHIEGFNSGAKWMQEEFLKDLWHDVDEIPKRAKAFIFECGDYSMNYHIGMMFNPNDYKKNAEIWHMNRWCYLEDILPKQEGGEQ